MKFICSMAATNGIEQSAMLSQYMGDIECLSFKINSTAAMYLTAVIFFKYVSGQSASFIAAKEGAVQMIRSNLAYEFSSAS